jgi:hypothetical protein
MRAVDSWLRLTALLAVSAMLQAGGPSAGAGQVRDPAVPGTLVVLIADQSLYLCPLCGERFISAYRRLAARFGHGALVIVVSPDVRETGPTAASGEAAARRIKTYLRTNGCRAPVLLDRSGCLHPPEGKTEIPGFVLDSSSGLVERLDRADSAPRGDRP